MRCVRWGGAVLCHGARAASCRACHLCARDTCLPASFSSRPSLLSPTPPLSPLCSYFENRTRQLASWSAEGITAYPHKFQQSQRIPEYVAQYAASIEDGQVRAVFAGGGRAMRLQSRRHD
jgi:hypothetical protein